MNRLPPYCLHKGTDCVTFVNCVAACKGPSQQVCVSRQAQDADALAASASGRPRSCPTHHPLLIPKGRRSRRSPEPPGHSSGLPSICSSQLLWPLSTWADIPRLWLGQHMDVRKEVFLENGHLRVIWSEVLGTGAPLPMGLREDCPVLLLLPSPLPTASCCQGGPGGISQAPPLQVTPLIALC